MNKKQYKYIVIEITNSSASCGDVFGHYATKEEAVKRCETTNRSELFIYKLDSRVIKESTWRIENE